MLVACQQTSWKRSPLNKRFSKWAEKGLCVGRSHRVCILIGWRDKAQSSQEKLLIHTETTSPYTESLSDSSAVQSKHDSQYNHSVTAIPYYIVSRKWWLFRPHTCTEYSRSLASNTQTTKVSTISSNFTDPPAILWLFQALLEAHDNLRWTRQTM